jgi:hypothetical protein
MSMAPTGIAIRTYQVGFGDCFLLSFQYDDGNEPERHVLIDFGSTGLPEGVAKTRMMDIARDIEERTNGKLRAVVATHRHKDHISGFATAKNGKGSGDVIRSLKPDLVVQPWTEDPDLAETATGPKRPKTGARALRAVNALALMHSVAEQTLAEAKRSRFLAFLPDRSLKSQLMFLGEDNLANKSAVDNLMTMARNRYVHFGADSGLEKLLPGVKVRVLGPPTVDQTDTIKKQRSKDPDEFWHFQANAMRFSAGSGEGGKETVLFPSHVASRGPKFPIDARWLIYHARALHGEQMLQIVRMLDTAMNNTSVILLFEVGDKRLLFPGDAQIENWQYALDQEEVRDLLSSVDLYKVGHHGSLNATPKSLWNLFRNKSRESVRTRLISLMSTMPGKHGSIGSKTEVPRRTLVSALSRETDHFSTEELEDDELYHDTEIPFSPATRRQPSGRARSGSRNSARRGNPGPGLHDISEPDGRKPARRSVTGGKKPPEPRTKPQRR